MVTVTEVNDGNDISGDAVEAHSCIDDSTDKKFLSRTHLNGKSTAGRFDLKVFVNCVQESSCLVPHPHVFGRLGVDTVDKDLWVKTSCS